MRSILPLLSILLVLFGQARAAELPRPKLQIINGSAQPVDIFWLKSGTERVPNGTVEPGRETIITTTLGHRFVVVGRADKSEASVTSEVRAQAFRFGGVPAFYTQRVSANGFPIVASEKVNPYANQEAAYLVNLMLANRPDVRATNAAVNHHEYFAEGVQSWFDNNRVNDHDHNHVNTRALLLEYDPGLADDLGYGDVGCYNSRAKAPTPNLDRLAREGLRFTDAHSPATVCAPSRYSLMTGQMAFRVPGGGKVFTGVGGHSLIATGRLTLPAMLRAQGYTTAAIGKWHVGLTFRDKHGQPIHDGGVDAVQRVDYSRRIQRRLPLPRLRQDLRADGEGICGGVHETFGEVRVAEKSQNSHSCPARRGGSWPKAHSRYETISSHPDRRGLRCFGLHSRAGVVPDREAGPREEGDRDSERLVRHAGICFRSRHQTAHPHVGGATRAGELGQGNLFPDDSFPCPNSSASLRCSSTNRVGFWRSVTSCS